ncbi:MAG: winged helix-turn-helix domain-containing protein [Desulfobaccales bacterium]
MSRSGEKIDLQPREFALLEYLLRQAGRVVSKTMILPGIGLIGGARKIPDMIWIVGLMISSLKGQIVYSSLDHDNII